MAESRGPTYIDYASPNGSERSVYFDAPIMHIFSKGNNDNEEGHVAPSPTTSTRIRTTPPIDSGRAGLVVLPEISSGDHRSPIEDGNADSDGDGGSNVLSRDYGALSAKRKPRQGSASTDDSGYGSPSPRRDAQDIQPIPVVWVGSNSQLQRNSRMSDNSADTRRSQSMRSFRSGTNRDGDGHESVRTMPTGRYTPTDRRRRVSLTGGTFANGAGMVGPAAVPHEDETNLFRSRSVSAESALSKKQKLKIGKEECQYASFDAHTYSADGPTTVKEGKRLATIIKQEAKVEKKALEASVKELAELQKLQKYAVKVSEKDFTAHTAL